MKKLVIYSLVLIMCTSVLVGCAFNSSTPPQPISTENLSPEQKACSIVQEVSNNFKEEIPFSPGITDSSGSPTEIGVGVDVFALQSQIKNLRDFVKYIPTWLKKEIEINKETQLGIAIEEISMHSNKLQEYIQTSEQIRKVLKDGDLGSQESFNSAFSTLDTFKFYLTDSFQQATNLCLSDEKLSKNLDAESSFSKETLPGPPKVSSDINLCKLPDLTTGKTSIPGTIFVGFPATPGDIPLTGNPKVLLLPVDWADVPGEQQYVQKGKQQAQLFSDYYSHVSSNKLNFKWKYHEEWVRLPGNSEEYKLDGPFPHPKLIQAAVLAADSKVDFSGIAGVYLLLPENQTVMHEGSQDSLLPGEQTPIAVSNEGEILSYVASGKLFDEVGHRTIWSHWVHETAHFLNMPDLYDHIAQHEKKALKIPIGPFSGYDMMSSQDGPSRTINSWSRFIMGWMDENEIYCQNLSGFESASFTLTPIDNNAKGLKSVIIRVSDSKAIVIESRRPTKYDLETKNSREGVVVFEVDTTLGHGEGYLKLVAPENRSLVDPVKGAGVDKQLDAVLYKSNFVTVEGVTVYVEKIGKKDKVSVIKE